MRTAFFFDAVLGMNGLRPHQNHIDLADIILNTAKAYSPAFNILVLFFCLALHIGSYQAGGEAPVAAKQYVLLFVPLSSIFFTTAAIFSASVV